MISYSIRKREDNWLLSTSYFLVDALIPIFGFFTIVVFYITGPIYRLIYKDVKLDVFELPVAEEAFEKHLEEKSLMMNEMSEEILKEDINIEPYVDILASDDLKLKINVIDKLTRLATPDAVRILKKALNDSNYEVRYFSNGALEKIERKYLTKIEAISETIKKYPDDYRSYNYRATIYLDMYSLGILDSQTAKGFLEKSLYDFLFSLQINKDQSYLFVKIVHIYLISKLYADVVSTSDMALRNNLSEEDRSKILFYRAEANFYLRNFSQVRDDCLNVISSNLDFELIKGPSEYWGVRLE